MSEFNPEKFIGSVYGRLTILSIEKYDGANSRVKSECECGCKKEFILYNVRNGNTSSCGCLSKEITTKRNTKHNGSKSRLYKIWSDMKERCGNPNNTRFERYGGRGIHVCKPWTDDFVIFRDWAVANNYSDDLTIDRIDNDKGYSPENCQWATHAEQMMNRSSTWFEEIDGVTKTAAEWCRIYDTNYQSAHTRKRAGHVGEDVFIIKRKRKLTEMEDE